MVDPDQIAEQLEKLTGIKDLQSNYNAEKPNEE
jgi:hypothetical protein